MGADKQAIGLFGGSFDPVHNGHLSIAQSFLESGFISSLWILLTPDPPHKEEQSLVSYSLRFKMLEKAFSDWEDVIVSDIETKLPKPSYTVQTLEYLNSNYPENAFYLCIGEDSAKNFTEWHKWETILSYCTLLIARRPSTKSTNLNSKIVENAHIVDHDPIDISSTQVRKRLGKGKDITSLVPSSVEQLIKKENLYQTI